LKGDVTIATTVLGGKSSSEHMATSNPWGACQGEGYHFNLMARNAYHIASCDTDVAYPSEADSSRVAYGNPNESTTQQWCNWLGIIIVVSLLKITAERKQRVWRLDNCGLLTVDLLCEWNTTFFTFILTSSSFPKAWLSAHFGSSLLFPQSNKGHFTNQIKEDEQTFKSICSRFIGDKLHISRTNQPIVAAEAENSDSQLFWS